MVQRTSNPGFVLGYHGLDRELGEKILTGEQGLIPSENAYDWLGHGIYFWEEDYNRAEEWAKERMKRPGSKIKNPFVIGAVIDLGGCLNLLRREDMRLLRGGYKLLGKLQALKGEPLPENTGGSDRLKRELDCGVVQAVHTIRKMEDEPDFDTVRGMFQEGDEPYPGAGFTEKNHIQICVRNLDCIKGYFLPLDWAG